MIAQFFCCKQLLATDVQDITSLDGIIKLHKISYSNTNLRVITLKHNLARKLNPLIFEQPKRYAALKLILQFLPITSIIDHGCLTVVIDIN